MILILKIIFSLILPSVIFGDTRSSNPAAVTKAVESVTRLRLATTLSASSEILDDIDPADITDVDGWPRTAGRHPDYPGGTILIGHVEDRAFLITPDAPDKAGHQPSKSAGEPVDA